MQNNLKTRNIKNFQGLRGVAIILVVISHYSVSGNQIIGYMGALGVSIFFMMSGYLLIYHNYNKSEKLQIIKYVKRKLIKFYPLHLLTLVLCIPLEMRSYFAQKNTNILIAFPCNLFLIQSWIPERDVYFSFNEVSWYLSTNMFLVLLSPFVVWLFKRYIKERSIWKNIFLMSSFVLFEYGWNLFVTAYGFDKAHWLVYICPLVRVADLLLGGVCCIISKYMEEKITQRNIKDIVSIAMIVCSCFSVIVIFILKIGLYKGFFLVAIWSIEIIVLLVGISISDGDTIIERVLFNNKVILWIGDLSFQIFLFHQFINTYVQTIFSKFCSINILLIRIIALVITLICSLIWSKLEKNRRSVIRSFI